MLRLPMRWFIIAIALVCLSGAVLVSFWRARNAAMAFIGRVDGQRLSRDSVIDIAGRPPESTDKRNQAESEDLFRWRGILLSADVLVEYRQGVISIDASQPQTGGSIFDLVVIYVMPVGIYIAVLMATCRREEKEHDGETRAS